MDGADFEELFSDDFPVEVRWERAIPCPCILSTGYADTTCAVCHGKGRTFAPLSPVFNVGLISQSARNRAFLAATMGPGAVGSSVLIVPVSAPCYDQMADGDRFYEQKLLDMNRDLLVPGTKISIPIGAVDLQAFVKNDAGDDIVPVAPPAMDSQRKVQVAVTTSLTYRAPRAYEVGKEFGSVRSFGAGLPKRWNLNLLDLTLR